MILFLPYEEESSDMILYKTDDSVVKQGLRVTSTSLERAVTYTT